MHFSPAFFVSKIFSSGLTVLMLLLGLPSAQAETYRVLLTPFRIHAAEEPAYLQDGITAILTSRLAQSSQIMVVSSDARAGDPPEHQQPLSLTEARARGQALQADFVVLGSLTVFGERISVDARLFGVAEGHEVLTLVEQGDDPGAVIPILSAFAAGIQNRILGLDTVAAVPPADPEGASTPEVLGPRAHPRKLAEQLVGQDGAAVRRPAPRDFMAERDDQRQLRLVWRSNDFNERITAMALGDVTGDGRVETVVASDRAVHLFRADADGFIKLDTLVELGRGHIAAVDVADINGNGYAEIFVSVLHVSRERAGSFVLEFNGRSFDRIVSDSPWFYRIDRDARAAGILYAQNQTGGPFANDIVRLEWESGAYHATERILPGGRANVLGLTVADLPNSPHRIVAYGTGDYLYLLDNSAQIHWRSLEASGGSLQYALLPGGSDGDIENRLYLPMRVKAVTLPESAGSGDEIVVVKNHDVAARWLAQFRYFSHAQVEAYVWDGVGLAPQWRTREINGRISDLAVGDFLNEGRTILLLSVVTREGSVVGTRPRSMLMGFELIIREDQ